LIGVGQILSKSYFLEFLRLQGNLRKMLGLVIFHHAYQLLGLLLMKNPFFFSFLCCFLAVEEYLDFITIVVIIIESNKLINFRKKVAYSN
jgi:cytochrome c oxidase subunit IV